MSAGTPAAGVHNDDRQDFTPETGAMLVSRSEMRFDFGGAKFQLPQDRDVLSWIFDQFLYGEVTGIQCGHWLYLAPTLEAATFFARQAVEELSHVRQFLRIYEMLGTRPGKPHPAVRFLATGSMGSDYVEHVATEMAVGEGLVLMIFYALIDTISDTAIVRILESATRQEERHVAFGEKQTRLAIEQNPKLADYLLGLNLISIVAMNRLGKFVEKRLGREHELLRQSPAFLGKMISVLELRLRRMGILAKPLQELGAWERGWLIVKAYVRRWVLSLRRKPRLLTDTYLRDHWVTRNSDN